MRKLIKNHIITVLGEKVGNTYIKTNLGQYYPIAEPKYTKAYKDYTKNWWVLKKHFFKWIILKVITYNR